MIVTKSNFDKTYTSMQNDAIFVIDTETTGLNVLDEDCICGIGIGRFNREAYYFPFRHSFGENLEPHHLKKIISLFEGKTLIGHNIKFDIKGLYKEGLNWKTCDLIETMVMVRLCSLDRYPLFSLEKVANKFLGFGRGLYNTEFKKFLRRNKIKKYSEAPIDIVGEYCCNDVLCTYDLYVTLGKRIKSTNQERVFEQDCRVTKTLLGMEINGVRVDLDYCNKCIELLSKKSEEMKRKVYELSGKEFNIDSHLQLTETLNSLGIRSPLETNKGKESWSQQAIVQMDNPIVKNISEYRTINLLKNTFFEPISERNCDIIHPSFKTWGTITGRLSCEKPNLQNIPRFTKDVDINIGSEESNKKKDFINRMVASGAGGSSISSWAFTGDEFFGDDSGVIAARRLFVPREGKTLFSFDFVQTEVAVFLYYAKEFDLLKKISDGEFDYHDYVAIEALGADSDDKETFQFIRQIGKGITFGIIYGMGNNTLATQIGKTVKEAKEFRKKYFVFMPKGELFIKNISDSIKLGKFLYNDYGRRYAIPSEEAYIGVNYLVQGTSGEIVKENMIEIEGVLEGTNSNMLIQIHDELLCEIDNNEFYLIPKIVKIMGANFLRIPFNVDVKKCYESWASKEDYDL